MSFFDDPLSLGTRVEQHYRHLPTVVKLSTQMFPLGTCGYQNVAVLTFDEGICAHSNEVFRELATLGKLASLLLV